MEQRRIRILFVDDDPLVRDISARMLETLGYDVIVASEAATALNILEIDRTVKILITDIVMPGKSDGIELAKMADKFETVCGIIFVSGYTEGKFDAALTLSKPFIFIQKPFKRAAIGEAILQLLV